MGIAEDLASVFEEIGTRIEIEGSLPVIYEYIDEEQNAQVSNPFIREHFIEATFKASTKIVPGSILKFVGTGTRYLVVNFSPENFENSIVVYTATLYKCNAFVEVQRQAQGPIDPVTRLRTVTWPKVFETHAPFTSSLKGSSSELNDRQEFLQFSTAEKVLYLPEILDVQVLDRVVLGTKKYKITNVEFQRFNGVVVCDMEEDTR